MKTNLTFSRPGGPASFHKRSFFPLLPLLPLPIRGLRVRQGITVPLLLKSLGRRLRPRFLLLGCLLWGVFCPVGAEKELHFHTGSGKVTFADYPPMADRPVAIYYYIPSSGDPEKMPVVFVMHGADRNARGLLDYWKAAADTHRFMVFIPELKARDYPLRDYQEVGLWEKDSTLKAPLRRTPVLIDRMFEYIRDRLGSTASGYTLYGHSAGGQFVQRFMLFHDSPYVEKAVISSPGWYTFLDTTQNYPYGVKNLPFVSRETLRNYLAKPIILQLGVGDTIREWYLRKTPEAEAQGANRYERGRTFYDSLAQLAARNGWPLKWTELQTLGIGHHSGLMGQAAVPFLFGDTTRVLFIGNSYTHVNKLPELVRRLAESEGRYLEYQMIAPGGCTLQRHVENPQIEATLRTGRWDFVVLQEQSRAPSQPAAQVRREVYPAARTLDSLRRIYQPQARTVFYMTWGRQDGDTERCAANPAVCTYEGMQARLRETYLEMTCANDAWCAPVGVAWKRVRAERPALSLYQPDKSHPSLAGSYLGASVFYTLFYGTPFHSAYTAGLDSCVAFYLQRIAQETVLENLGLWNIRPTLQPQAVTERFYPAPPGTFHSPTLGKEAGEGLASLPEIQKFLVDLAAAHPDRIRLDTLGTTPEGRNIPVLYSPGTPAASPSPRLKVWIQGGLHGNEPAGTETVCRLAAYLLESEEGKRWLDQLDIALVPVANPDGYALQQRPSAGGLDLNRDQTKLADPVSVLLKQAFTAWQPEVALDIHEFRPFRKEFSIFRHTPAATYADALFLPTGHPNVPEVLRKMTVEQFEPEAAKALAAAGYTSGFYFTPEQEGNRLTLLKGAKSPQSSSTSFALANAVSMFVEIRGIGLGPVSFARRTDVGFQVARSFLQTAVRQKDRVKKAVATALKETLGRKHPVVVLSEAGAATCPVSFVDLVKNERFTVQLPVKDALRARPVVIRTRPRAYFLADTCRREVENLRTLGVQVEQLDRPQTLRVSCYRVTNMERSSRPWEKIYPVQVHTSLQEVTRTFPAGSYRIDLAQRGANFAVTLLEPESANGFVGFGVTPASAGLELPVYRWE